MRSWIQNAQAYFVSLLFSALIVLSAVLNESTIVWKEWSDDETPFVLFRFMNCQIDNYTCSVNNQFHTGLQCYYDHGWINEKGIVIAGAEANPQMQCVKCTSLFFQKFNHVFFL